MRNKSKGFTLIELLVVIAIIGILSSVVLASLNSARQKSRDAKRVADMKQLQLALELYYDANSSTYPTEATVGGAAILETGPMGLFDTCIHCSASKRPVQQYIQVLFGGWCHILYRR